MNIANSREEIALIGSLAVAFLLAIAPTDGAAANKSPKTNNANARGQSQPVSANRGLPGTKAGTQDATGKLKVPGRIEYPNLTASGRSADRVQLEPTSQEYPNVIGSIGVKYTMIRGSRSNAAGTTKHISGEKSPAGLASGNSHLPASKNEVSIETLEPARVNSNSYWLPEVGDEVLSVKQSDNPSSRIAGNQRRMRR